MRRGENIYKRKDGRWEGRYKKGKKANGKTKYGSVYGRTLSEVRSKLYPLKSKYQEIRGKYGESSMSLEWWGTSWLTEMKQEVKESTYANYQYKLTHYVFPVIGTYALNELTPEIGAILLTHLQKKQLSASTIRVIFRILNQCLNQAKSKEYVTENSFTEIKLPKAGKEKARALTREEQRRLEKTANTEKANAGFPVLLALHSGLRIGEIAALQWEDIDFQTNLIRVRHTLQRVKRDHQTELILTSSKTDSSVRTIPLSDTMRILLWEHKKQAISKFVFSTNGHAIEPRLLTYHFHKIRKKVGLEQIHFHQLRHTFATRCIETQGDIASVSAILGHRSTQMTLDTYTDALIEQRVRVVKQMEKAIA
ncbi:site-specific integrase [Enterococcus florum]|uniref:Site-specific integrase n=1 Tax=Enterococcus florum TaxID=2480627 RepID=A0A4P5PHP4_9ENTE|nr:site-specific integrase [Enterococcus florum]GCF95941.1 site-specific integrase [Enterococcus florum]